MPESATTAPAEVVKALATIKAGDRVIRQGDRRWMVKCNPHCGTVFVFERKAGKKYIRWSDTAVAEAQAR